MNNWVFSIPKRQFADTLRCAYSARQADISRWEKLRGKNSDQLVRSAARK